MAGNEPIAARNLDGYGAPVIDWARVRDVLHGDLTQAPETGGPGRHTAWLTTIDPDGSPLVMPVDMMSVGGAWHVSSGPGTRESRDPRCTMSTVFALGAAESFGATRFDLAPAGGPSAAAA